MPRAMARPGMPLAVIAVASVAILAALAAGLVDVDPIVRAISTSFVAVYVAATAAGVRLLDGRLRATAALSLALVVAVLAFSGPYVAAPAGIALLALGFVSARALALPGACHRQPATATDLRPAPTRGR
jgi:amino acid efflux transporter